MESAVIFDLDGTLWDATGRIPDIWNGVFRRRGLSVRVNRADARRFMGVTMDEIGLELFPEKSPPEAAAMMEECGRAEVRTLRKTGGALYDGVRETLETLGRSYRLMLVSNCQAGYVSAFLEAHGLGGYFSDAAESGGTGLSKAENIRLVMERNGTPRAVYVGDTRRDEDASRAAGIPFIHAAYGFGDAASPDAVIHRFSDLPAAAASLLADA